jgi:hypothetical protein
VLIADTSDVTSCELELHQLADCDAH